MFSHRKAPNTQFEYSAQQSCTA